MIPAILTGIITNLAVQAIVKSAGPLTRAAGLSKPAKPPEWLVDSLTPTVSSSVITMLAELKSQNVSENNVTKAAESLRSIEAQQLQRMLVVDAITHRPKDPDPRLREQVEALLIYVGSCDRQDAETIAPLLAKILNGVSVRAVATFQKSAGKYYGIIKSLALQEETAGYIEQLFLKVSPQDWRPTSEDLASIDLFAHRYATEMATKTALLTPQHFDIQIRVSLGDLYVAPRFVARDSDIDRLMPMAETSQIYGSEIDFPLGHAMRRMYRAVVLGSPGAGKTTLTQKIIHELCIDPSKAHLCLPFLVTLRKYDERRREDPISITNYIATSISTELHITVSDQYIEYFLRTGRAAVILDGLDELLHPSRRKEVAEIVHSFARRYPKCSIIVTSRIVGYDEASLDSKIFSHMYLSDFNDAEVQEYATNWFKLNLNRGSADPAIIVREFMRESETVAELRKNPLLLSLMCNIYRGKGYIPQNRSDLYERCASMLFDEWDRSRGIESGGPLRGDAKYALQDIAYWALTHRELDSGIPEPMLKKKLTKFLKDLRYGSEAMAEEAASDLLRMWRGRAWILTDFGSDALHRIYQFSHRTFLEYFAATHLARKSKSPQRLWQELRSNAISGEWDVVAEIAIQTYNAGKRGATDEIYKLITKRMSSIKDASELTAELLEEMRFACWHLEALAPGPKVLIDLTIIAVNFILWSQPCFDQQPDLSAYESKRDLMIPEAATSLEVPSVGVTDEDETGYEDEDYEFEDEDTGRQFRTLEETRRLLNTPLALIFDSSPVILSIASDAFDAYCRELISTENATPQTASLALVMLLSKAEIIQSSRFSAMDVTIGGELHAPGSKRLEVSQNLPIEEIDRLGPVNFWIPIIAARHGYLTLRRLLQLSDWRALFNGDSPFDVLFSSARPTLAEEVIVRYCSYAATNDDREALGEVGRQARRRVLPPIEPGWVLKSNVGKSIVKGYFLNTPALSPDNGYYDRYWQDHEIYEEPCEEEDLDVLLGAAVVLCVFAELEDWEMADLSSDRLASLMLGPVSGVEGVYLARFGGEGIEDTHVQARTRLASADVAMLLDWAGREFAFTSG